MRERSWKTGIKTYVRRSPGGWAVKSLDSESRSWGFESRLWVLTPPPPLPRPPHLCLIECLIQRLVRWTKRKPAGYMVKAYNSTSWRTNTNKNKETIEQANEQTNKQNVAFEEIFKNSASVSDNSEQVSRYHINESQYRQGGASPGLFLGHGYSDFP